VAVFSKDSHGRQAVTGTQGKKESKGKPEGLYLQLLTKQEAMGKELETRPVKGRENPF
jgi:hypothetical protein